MLTVIAAFLALQDADEAIKKFNETMADKDATVQQQVQAVNTLGAVKHEKTMKHLVRIFVHPEVDVAAAAAGVLGEFKDIKGTAAKLASALLSKPLEERTPVRIMLVRSIGKIGDVAGLPALHVALRARDLFVAKEVVAQLEVMRHKSSLPVLIDYLKLVEKSPGEGGYEGLPSIPNRPELPGTERLPQWAVGTNMSEDDYQKLRNQALHVPMVTTLKKLTQEDWETYKGWLEWWQRKGGGFEIPAP